MTRNDINAEIARIDAATPSKVAAFNQSRAARRADLVAMLAALPQEATQDAPELAAFLTAQAKAERSQRATERRGY